MACVVGAHVEAFTRDIALPMANVLGTYAAQFAQLGAALDNALSKQP